MKQAFSLILICLFFFNPLMEAQHSPKVLRRLLLCENEENLKGQIHSITTKHGMSFKERKIKELDYSTYNAQNQVIKRVHPRTKMQYYYGYSPEGLLNNLSRYREDVLFDSILYVYNDEGALTHELTYGKDRHTLKQTIEVYYDSTGMPIRAATRKVNSVVLERVLEVGDDFIKIFSVLDTKMRGDTSGYLFDPIKRCIKPKLEKRVVNSINGKTRIEIIEGVPDERSVLIRKYEYDEVGNWTSVEIYNVKEGKEPKPKDLLSIFVREIKYR